MLLCSYLRPNVLRTGEPYEIYIPGDMFIFEQHWKHNSWNNEILQWLPGPCQNAQPPQVPIPVVKVGHVTHYDDAKSIVTNGLGNKVGFTFNVKIGKDATFKKVAQDSFQKIGPEASVMPGAYSWWSVCLPDDLRPPKPPPQLRNAPDALHAIRSPCLASSYASVYGTIGMTTEFRVLLQSYSQLFGNAEITYKCGGTLLYRKEVCQVIIVCCKVDGKDPPELQQFSDYDFKGAITLTRPFKGVKYIPKGDRDPSAVCLFSASSWDIFVFAFYHPIFNEMPLLSVPSRSIWLVQLEHFIFNRDGSRLQEGQHTTCHKNNRSAGTRCPDFMNYKYGGPPFKQLLKLIGNKRA